MTQELNTEKRYSTLRSNPAKRYLEVTLFDLKVDSSEALFRGNDKTFDETPGSKEYLTSTLLHKLKE